MRITHMLKLAKFASVAAGLFMSCAASAAEYVWIEGESPSSVPTIAPAGNPDDKGYEFKGWGNAKLFSESKALNIHIEDKDVEKRIPKDGAIFGNGFEVKGSGKFETWARIG